MESLLLSQIKKLAQWLFRLLQMIITFRELSMTLYAREVWISMDLFICFQSTIQLEQWIQI
jgi:hypothetical protein